MLNTMDDKSTKLLCYNILPNCDTIMHKLSSNYPAQLKLFQIAHRNEDKPEEMQFPIPFILNFYDESPIHLVESKAIDMMLRYLKGYGIDHHSREINDHMPELIKKVLPSLLPYLSSRM